MRSDGQVVPVPGTKQRALLAVLLLHANEVVGSEWLLEALWQRPPRSGVNALQVRVSQLRKALGAGGAALETRRPSGYCCGCSLGSLISIDSSDWSQPRKGRPRARRRRGFARRWLCGEALR